MMQVKGSAIVAMPKFVAEKHGDFGYRKWLDTLSPPAKQVYGGHIMASNWYPFREMMVEPTQKMCDQFYGGSIKGAMEAGRFSADVGLNGFYKIFVKAGSPDFILKRASTIMAGYYSPSQLGLVESSPGKAVLQITKFEEPSPLVEARIAGWMQRALEINGCKNVMVITPKSLTKGDPLTEYVLKWN
jgi:hypothetical protein